MKTKTIAICAAVAAAAAFANQPGGRDAFLKQQAYEEMQRVSGQIDVLESNMASISERVSKLERGGGEIAALKAEIDALKSEISRLKGEMQTQRKEIVSDIVKRIPPPQPVRQSAPPPVHPGEVSEYTVQRGDTLSLISQAFSTTVSKLKELNSLKNDNLRIGQKLFVPSQGAKRR